MAVESFEFYDGHQWTQEEIQTLYDRGQPAITVNKIAPKVDNISGVEETSRTIVTFEPRTFQPEDKILADSCTSIAVKWQEMEDVAYKNSDAFKDMLKCGIGWVGMAKKSHKPFDYNHIDPFEMVWDVDDRTPNLTNQRFVARTKFMDVDELSMSFPNKAAELVSLLGEKPEIRKSRTSFGIDSAKGAAIDSYENDDGGKLLVVEVQYREARTFYTYVNDQGKMKYVLDESTAKKNKAKGTKVGEITRFVTKFAQYTTDILLSHGLLSEQDESFEYIPQVFKREKISGVPYGIIENAKDIQREINKRRSKSMHYLNTQRILLDEEVTDVQDYNALRSEMSRPDGILAGKGIKIDNNLDLAQGQQIIYQQSNQELEGVMGVFDESLGDQTNASSGIAIQSRQGASLRNQSTAFDKLRFFKKRMGRKMLAMMQDIQDQNILVNLLDENGQQSMQVILNSPYKSDNGKEVFEYDLSTINFDVVVKEDVQYDAPPAEVAERVTNIIMNGQGALLSNPQLLKLLGVKNPDEISKVLAQQPSPEQQQMQQQGGEAKPSMA